MNCSHLLPRVHERSRGRVIGLYRSVCQSVLGVSAIAMRRPIIHGCGRAALRIRVLLSTETKEQKKRGRPGNEASHHAVETLFMTLFCHTFPES